MQSIISGAKPLGGVCVYSANMLRHDNTGNTGKFPSTVNIMFINHCILPTFPPRFFNILVSPLFTDAIAVKLSCHIYSLHIMMASLPFKMQVIFQSRPMVLEFRHRKTLLFFIFFYFWLPISSPNPIKSRTELLMLAVTLI